MVSRAIVVYFVADTAKGILEDDTMEQCIGELVAATLADLGFQTALTDLRADTASAPA